MSDSLFDPPAAASDYVTTLKGVVALHDRMQGSLAQFAHRLRTCIQDEFRRLSEGRGL